MVSSGSLITKKIIAYSFKELMKQNEFEKIYIKEIMNHADYRRQTFYDHFSDKYELLDWIYNQEITEIIEHFISYEHWTKIIPRILHYFEKNKKFYQKTLTIKDHHSFDACLVQHTQLLFQNILMENNQQKLPLKQIEQNSSFYAYGITGIIKSWLLQDCQTPNNDMENYLISVIESTIIKND